VFRSAQSPIGDEYNVDAGFARRVAGTIGANHHEVACDDGDTLAELLGPLVTGLDEPVWEMSFVSIFLMSRLAREHGIKVLLTGDGSDELFAGYPWIAAAWRQEFYERIPLLGAVLPALTRMAPAGSTLRLHAQNLQSTIGQPDLTRYEQLHSIFNRHERRALTGREEGLGSGAVAAVVEPLLAGAQSASRADRLALLDLALWVREHFNQRVDRMTMLNSVEARVPFQDNEVVDLGLSLPFGVKAPGGQAKKLLKYAFRQDIPEFVLRRQKRPFAAPMGAWETGALGAVAEDALAPERLRATGLIDPLAAQHALRAGEPRRRDRRTAKLWTLVMLQLWAEGLGTARPPASPANSPLTTGAA
ncbi:MAG: asparagine synthase C-terminal domain-containing protein, partial [Chloroflexota bacterium]|nr:asparagine synthase C-terminal domain-containing protein [Chloroflexota bacterium]